MTPFLYCKKAELPGLNGGKPVQAAVSLGAIGGLLVTAPRELEYPLRAPIIIRFYDPILGVVTCRCSLSSPLVSGTMRSYRCEILEQLSQSQRREDIKVPLSIMVYIDCEGLRFPAAVQNISAGGVYLITSLAAAAGDRFSFDFPKTDPPVPLTAEILRVELRVNHNGRSGYGYGCRFVDLPPQHEAQLRSFVFQEERQLYYPKKTPGPR